MMTMMACEGEALARSKIPVQDQTQEETVAPAPIWEAFIGLRRSPGAWSQPISTSDGSGDYNLIGTDVLIKIT